MALIGTHRILTVRERACRIVARIKGKGARQVRYYGGMFLTYPFPAPRGYGTRGVLVGVYTGTTPASWVEDDINMILSDSHDDVSALK